MTQKLLFTLFSSLASPSFWHKLTELKLDVHKLSDAEVDITASYGAGRLIRDREANKDVEMNAPVMIEDKSFTGGVEGYAVAKGTLKNYNTIEEFKAADKTKLFNSAADKIWNSIVHDHSVELLNSFLLITFADLKKYKYFYWFAFPALQANPAWELEAPITGVLQAGFSQEQLSKIHSQISSPYFLVHDDTVHPVSAYAQFPSHELIIGFIDPCADPDSAGWPLRNFLAYFRALHPESTTLTVLCWRDADLPRDSLWRSRVAKVTVAPSPTATNVSRPGAIGWERNPQGKLAPRLADLAPMMDPSRLANQAVDLNLKLMRWRILPSLDLDRIASTKCLLLGAGTLGCYVSRCLMGWGVRNITLVDSGRVSFSNPVRQPLFTFQDSLGGGQPKAETAAKRLKDVWPGINATGHTLSIPMPGHPIPESPPSLVEQVKKDVEKLEQLIEEHDVVYLLMDSRESRWLPTVLGKLKGKLVLNAALGFDTFLVMRHGARPRGDPQEAKLGCYYCNDIVAPADSLTDRTLDQMCTVTRPGLASIASSTAVELMTSVLQHPQGIYAPTPPVATTSNALPDLDGPGTSVLGLIPHQLRGYLAQFRNLHIVGAQYDRCTGCSETVLTTYEKEGFSMLLKAFNDPKYLEKLTGLDQLFAEGEAALKDVELMEEGTDEDDF